MINLETILSLYDDKPTLMKWLKKVEEALKNASAVAFVVNKKGNATISFSILFNDGTKLESGDIVLQEGESVESASIVDGDLVLTLTNGEEINAGNLGGVSSFEIDASQHLIVHFQNGTTQDLGAIFQGNINISGDLSADTIEQRNANRTFSPSLITPLGYVDIEDVYTRFEVINGVFYFVCNFKLTNNGSTPATIAAGDIVMNSWQTLNASLAALIFDVLGNPASSAVVSETKICAETLFIGEQAIYTPWEHRGIFGLMNGQNADQIRIFARTDEALTIPVGDSFYFSGRVSLTLL